MLFYFCHFSREFEFCTPREITFTKAKIFRLRNAASVLKAERLLKTVFGISCFREKARSDL